MKGSDGVRGLPPPCPPGWPTAWTAPCPLCGRTAKATPGERESSEVPSKDVMSPLALSGSSVPHGLSLNPGMSPSHCLLLWGA